MDFHLKFEIAKSKLSIQHQSNIIFLGSCFSDEISNYFINHGFKVQSNPFGTLFHPLSISSLLDNSKNQSKKERIIQRNDVFLSLDASGTIFEYTEENLFNKLKKIRTDLNDSISTCDFLFITFGTAWGYSYENEIVGNCHKLTSSNFEKKLYSVDEIKDTWSNTIENIKKINPSINIIFTVSPVRHIKDGVIENNQSKAILIESIRQLNLLHHTSYFPSYEIMIDELRDYRFFKKDLVHPNELAIAYIWDRIKQTYFQEETLQICDEINKLRQLINHKSIYTNSIENKKHLDSIEEKMEVFRSKYPYIKI